MRILVLIPLLFLVLCCETEFDLIEKKDPQPVIYCLLDANSNVQQLRISRTYLNYQGQLPPGSYDSIRYFGQIDARLELVVNDQVTETAKFKAFEIQKDSGLFPNEVQLIYRTNMEIKPSNLYRLVIYIHETDHIVYSYTQSISRHSIVDPQYPEIRPLHFDNSSNPIFHWTQSVGANVYQLGYKLRYQEISDVGTEVKQIEIPLNMVFFSDHPGGFYSYSINSAKFYIGMAELIPEDPSVQRKVIAVDAFVSAGGEELGLYIKKELNADPFRVIDYNNVYNGIGLFSSLHREIVSGFSLTDQTIDSIAYGKYTRQLNFLDRHGKRIDQ